MSAGTFTFRLCKEDFKFSAAHFTVFGSRVAETLHGHNYHVGVEVEGDRLDEIGLLTDIAPLKKAIRARCAELDSLVLVPESCPYLEIERDEESVIVRWADRCYRFPAREVVLLPLANITVEELARMLWRDLARLIEDEAVRGLAVTVEETAGQGCVYRASLR